MISAIAAARLRNQFISRRFQGTPAALVERMGAVQAQEYAFARWALALRLAGNVADADVAAAFDRGDLLRTHVMRPTWHFVTPADIRWMLALTAPRVHRLMASYLRRRGLEPRLLTRAVGIFERALAGRNYRTRVELREDLARAGIAATGVELGFVTMYAELEAVICSGPRRGNQFTYALLGERAPSARQRSRDESLAELTRRYFTTHGPATVRDFVWWSGLTVADTRRGLDMIGAQRLSIDGLDYWRVGRLSPAPPTREVVHLLPIYDEYLVAYRDRVAVPHGPGTIAGGPRSVMFRHALVSGGAVAGTWNMKMIGRRCSVDVTPLRKLSRAEKEGIAEAATRFGRFLATEVSLRLA